MRVDTIATLSGMVIIIGFLWSLHRDVAGLRERMARLEGAFDGLRDAVNRLDSRMTGVEARVRGPEGTP